VKKTTHGFILSAALALLAAGASAAEQAFRPGQLWLDDKGVHINAHGGGIVLHAGTYYWYGEHKVEGKIGNTAQVGVHVYSSTNLHDWKDEGIALAVSDDPAHELVKGSVIERPKVVYNARTRKFVMWFHLEFKGLGYKSARAGVAVADRPAGPFVYLGSLRPNAGAWPVNLGAAERDPAGSVVARDHETGQMARDMTLFVDDDGTAYHIFASEENHTLHVSRLSDDYTRPTGQYARVAPGGDNEAPALFKAGGKYYLFASGLTGWAPNAARSFMADSMFGPWTSLGNPVRGTEQERATTFGGQSTHVLPYRGGFIFMADIWTPDNPINGRYAWLPVEWENGKPVMRWQQSWSLPAQAKLPSGRRKQARLTGM
jgi:hypothetical protein